MFNNKFAMLAGAAVITAGAIGLSTTKCNQNKPLFDTPIVQKADIASAPLGNNIQFDSFVHSSDNNEQGYASSECEDTFVKATEPRNGYWVTIDDILNGVKKSGQNISEKENKLITSLYNKADKSIKKQDGILQHEELNNLIKDLEKSKLRKTNEALYLNLAEFLNDRFSKANTNQGVANNLSIAAKDLKNSKMIEQAILSLNKDSVYGIADSYYQINKRNDFFQNIVKFGVFYNTDSTSAAVIIDKVIEGYDGLIKYAKANNINVKDFEKTIKEYRKKHRYTEMALEMDNLFKRIYVSQNTDLDTPLNKRKLALNKPNSFFDKSFAQGDADDCWLLAAVIASLNDSVAKQKINNMITVYQSDDVDSVKVDFGNKSYTFDYEELLGATEFSSGDLDSRALEIAVNNSMREQYSTVNAANNDLLKGFQQLYGKNNIESKRFYADNDYIKELKNSNGLSVIGSKSNVKDFSLLDEDNNKVPAVSRHAYAVVGVDNKFLYLVNPWNSSKKLKCPIEDVDKIFNDAVIVNLKESV